MNSFNIHPVNKDDLPFLWEMLYQSIFVSEGAEPVDRDILKLPLIAKYMENWGREGDMGFIAVNDTGNPVGSITIRYFSDDCRGYGYVNGQTPELGMAVMPEFRGKGVGTALLKTMLEEAKNKGIYSISLSVNIENPAMRLYKRMGFKDVETTDSAVMMINLI